MTTEQVHEEMSKVQEVGLGMTTIAKAVDSINLNLAHHAAWTEERFEAIDRRFEAIDVRFDVVDQRFEAMDRKIDSGHNLILGEISKMSARVEQVLNFAIRDELKIREVNE